MKGQEDRQPKEQISGGNRSVSLFHHVFINYDGEVEAGEFPNQLSVAGQELNCLYIGLETTLRAMLLKVQQEMKMGV